MNSAQLGDDAIVDVICLLRDFREVWEDVEREIISWRLEGGRVKRRGNVMFAVVANVFGWESGGC
jgi:hypothetical protein